MRVYKGHVSPYGAWKDAGKKVKSNFYSYGYLRDSDWPELPEAPPTEWNTDPFELLLHKQQAKLLREAMSMLPPRAERVLCLRYFMDLTMEEVGELLGVTGVKIRQIEAQALRALRHPSRMNVIRGLVPAVKLFMWRVSPND